MSLKIIPNTVWSQAVQLKVTDTSNSATTDGDKLANVTTGGRQLSWTQSGTAGRRIVYVNKDGAIDYDTFIVTDADNHNTHKVEIVEWTTYTSTAADEFSSTNFAETLVGRNSTDWIYERSTEATNLQALGLELDDGTGGAYAKTVGKIYAGTAIEYTYGFSLERKRFYKFRINEKGNQAYAVIESVKLTFNNFSDTLFDSLDNLYRNTTDPIFVYDTTGNEITEKLLHCLIVAKPVVHDFNDIRTITLDLEVLAH